MTRDTHDIIGGALLVAAGLCVAGYAIGHYDIGTVRRMGPGMFPMGAGVVLAALGTLIVLPALFRQANANRGGKFHLDSALPVLVGIVAFALVVQPLGLMPAIILLVAISSLAISRPKPLEIALLCAVLCLVAFLVFRLALNLPLTLFSWPW